MVQAQSQTQQFYDIPGGQDSGNIKGTRGSLISLPTMQNKQPKLIACGGPSSDKSIQSFWKDLVLGQGATLIVNLCGEVGDRADYNWYVECSQYWPTPKTDHILAFGSDIQVSLISETTESATLKSSQLLVNELSRGVVVKSARVTLLHFSGWPDCDIPAEEEELEGFNLMMNKLVAHYTAAATRNQKAVVHCRQGHGRTGTTVTILSRLLQRYHETF